MGNWIWVIGVMFIVVMITLHLVRSRAPKKGGSGRTESTDERRSDRFIKTR